MMNIKFLQSSNMALVFWFFLVILPAMAEGEYQLL